MSKVRIVQYLCPQRHCILAAASDDTTDAELIHALQQKALQLIAEKQFNPICGICGARQDRWVFEVGVTKFDSLEEAMPHLEQCQLQQMLSRIIMDELGLTHDSLNKKPRL